MFTTLHAALANIDNIFLLLDDTVITSTNINYFLDDCLTIYKFDKDATNVDSTISLISYEQLASGSPAEYSYLEHTPAMVDAILALIPVNTIYNEESAEMFSTLVADVVTPFKRPQSAQNIRNIRQQPQVDWYKEVLKSINSDLIVSGSGIGLHNVCCIDGDATIELFDDTERLEFFGDITINNAVAEFKRIVRPTIKQKIINILNAEQEDTFTDTDDMLIAQDNARSIAPIDTKDTVQGVGAAAAAVLSWEHDSVSSVSSTPVDDNSLIVDTTSNRINAKQLDSDVANISVVNDLLKFKYPAVYRAYKPVFLEKAHITQNFLTNGIVDLIFDSIFCVEAFNYNILATAPVSNSLDYYNIKQLHADFDFTFKLDFKLNLFYTVYTFLTKIKQFKFLQKTANTLSDDIIITAKPADIIYDSIDLTKREFMLIYSGDALSVVQEKYDQIRFKPGYYTFFKKLREEYSAINRLNFIYDHKLTKYLTFFKKCNNITLLNVATLALSNVLVMTHLAITHKMAEQLILRGIIYINNACVHLCNFQLQVGDIVQLQQSYMVFAFLLTQRINRVLQLNNNFRLLQHFSLLYNNIKSKQSAGNADVDFFFKRFGVKKLLKIYYLFYDIPAYIELDYLTLSFIVLYQPNSFGDFDYLTLRHNATTYIRMLNWKYIN